MTKFKYILIFVLPLSVAISFISDGLLTFFPILIFFIVVPLVELLLPADFSNVADEDKEKVGKDSFFSIIVYLLVPLQLAYLIWYLVLIGERSSTTEFVGRTISMGIMCGVIGINVGHELGHRMSRFERTLGVILLLTSFDSHFKPYHNRGHHYDVGTPEDPATARINEPIYFFIFRSHYGSYLKAWKVEHKRMKIIGSTWFSIRNNMIEYTIYQIAILIVILAVFGPIGLYGYFLVSTIGIVLLEIVNYIEHYGLTRKMTDANKYESVKLHHSWNSNQLIGRLLLFELSRHSDHHAKPDRPYQILQSHEGQPQMPTGYPGMMLLTLVPPLFFRAVNPLIKK